MKRIVDLLNNKSRPLINILIRTSRRPNYFKTCMESIYRQSYKKLKVLVSYDDIQSYAYLKTYKRLKTIRVFKREGNYPEQDVPRDNKQLMFPANLFLNDLMNEVKEGFIMALDDDDCLTGSNSIKTIVDKISGEDDLLFWRVKFPDGRIIPEDEYFKKAPVFRHISGIGFLFHSKYIQFAQWDGWRGGDFAVATKLFEVIPNKIHIDKVLTGLQRTEGWGGRGARDDKDAGGLLLPEPF